MCACIWICVYVCVRLYVLFKHHYDSHYCSPPFFWSFCLSLLWQGGQNNREKTFCPPCVPPFLIISVFVLCVTRVSVTDIANYIII